MAITHVKVTYSVQPHTAQRVQELATKWSVPKSEVIRRAVEEAARAEALKPRLTPLQALDELMSRPPSITKKEAEQWMREVRLERRASGEKRGREQDREWKKYDKIRAAAAVKEKRPRGPIVSR